MARKTQKTLPATQLPSLSVRPSRYAGVPHQWILVDERGFASVIEESGSNPLQTVAAHTEELAALHGAKVVYVFALGLGSVVADALVRSGPKLTVVEVR